MRRGSPNTRKHFYDLTDSDAKREAEERIDSFTQLAEDADRVWTDNGYRHILVNQLCLKYTYRKTGDVLYIEWKTCHKSSLDHR